MGLRATSLSCPFACPVLEPSKPHQGRSEGDWGKAVGCKSCYVGPKGCRVCVCVCMCACVYIKGRNRGRVSYNICSM